MRLSWSARIYLGLLATVIGIALGADFLTSFDPGRGVLLDNKLPPGGDHPLGTDLQGRDVLARLMYGARVSLSVAIATVAIGGFIGTLVGIAAGYAGGRVDAILMRIVDVALAFPLVLLAIVLAVVFGPSLTNIIIVISLLIWPRVARQIRGETLVIRRREFVSYAEIAGVPAWIVAIRHILPNVAPTLLVLLTLEVGQVILLESALSYLGAGIPPPSPSWGRMVAEGQGQLATGWWIALFPGLAILVTVLSFNGLGDWLRDTFDPTLRGQ